MRWACRAMDRQLGAEGEATGTIDGFIHALDGKPQPGEPMSIEDMRKVATAGWAGAMESVRLSGDPLGSLAGIDEIINRGDREAFSGLLNAIIEQPGSPVADRVRTLYDPSLTVPRHISAPPPATARVSGRWGAKNLDTRVVDFSPLIPLPCSACT